MLVSQLIEELSKLDPNAKCYAYAYEDIEEIRQVTVNKEDEEDEWVYCKGCHPFEYNKRAGSIVIIGGR